MRLVNAYRLELRLTVAAENSEEASKLLDQLTGIAEAAGANFESGYVEPDKAPERWTIETERCAVAACRLPVGHDGYHRNAENNIFTVHRGIITKITNQTSSPHL